MNMDTNQNPFYQNLNEIYQEREKLFSKREQEYLKQKNGLNNLLEVIKQEKSELESENVIATFFIMPNKSVNCKRINSTPFSLASFKICSFVYLLIIHTLL